MPHAGLRLAFESWRAQRAGRRAASLKRSLAPVTPQVDDSGLLPGVSVVIPSRDGRALLERLFPTLLPHFGGTPAEVIVSDNGSTDGTAAWLHEAHPNVTVLESREPLSFAAAVNRGILRARHTHTLLLNNDMVLEQGFTDALLSAFVAVPHLFCATAQIFFPEGKRREETGKAMLRVKCAPDDFPVTCLIPAETEDLTPVTYGSGGCSLYDTAKLRALGGLGEMFLPAYVEDLDLGWRGWEAGWPTVFAARARAVHHHRSTTARFFNEEQIQQAVERNYLRFLARSVGDPELFLTLWTVAIDRLRHRGDVATLAFARQAHEWVEASPGGKVPRYFRPYLDE